MKVRLNYVSNSSSSSFCVMGITFNSGEADDEVIFEYLDTHSTSISLCEGLDVYDGELVLGIAVTEMKDTETLKQFKARAYRELNKLNAKLKLGLNVDKDNIRWRIDGGFD